MTTVRNAFSGLLLIGISCAAVGADATKPAEGAAPATAPATAPASQPAENSPAARLIQRMEQLGRAFDPALADLYHDDAVIRHTRIYPDGRSRSMTIPAPKYKAMLRNLMGVAKARGDVSTYSEIKFTAEGDRIRVDATRYSELKDYQSPISWLVGPGEGGEWVIFEEISESRP